MPRKPSDFKEKLSDKVKQEADKVEKLVDQDMDKNYAGGGFIFDTYTRKIVIHQALLDELRRRYPAWKVEYKSCCDSRDGDSSAWLMFAPVSNTESVADDLLLKYILAREGWDRSVVEEAYRQTNC